MAFKKAYLFLSLSMASSLFAATWTGAADNFWINSSNWIGGVPAAGGIPNFPSVANSHVVNYSGLGSSPLFSEFTMTSTSPYTIFTSKTGDKIRFDNSGFAKMTLDGTVAGTDIGGELQINNTLTINSTNFQGTTISAAISEGQAGSSIVIENAGPITFAAPNSSYSGSTTLKPGSKLIINENGSLGASSLFLELSSTFTITSSMLFTHPIHLSPGPQPTIFIEADKMVTFSMPITGVGLNGFIKSGTGTLILTGTNTYIGNTTVNQGTLAINGNVSLGSSTTSLILNNLTTLQAHDSSTSLTSHPITLNGSTTFDTNGNVLDIATSITGGGSLTKISAGTLILGGSNSYAGSTTVSEGTLAVNGSIAGSGVFVSSAATLEGTGTINAPVVVDGSLAPGNPLGTLTVLAPVTLNNGSSLELEFNPTTSSLLNVVGAGVTINSAATLNLIPETGIYSSSVVYKLIQTTGGISGPFNSFDIDSLFLEPVFQYTPNDLLMTLQILDFTDVLGSGGNVGAVAGALDNSQAPVGSDMSNVIAHLMAIPEMNDLIDAVSQLQPALCQGYALSQENMSIRIRSIMTKRAGSLSQNDCLKRCCIERGWTLWFDGLGDWSRQHNQDKQIGFHTASGAGAIGADYQVADNFYLGLSGAYSSTDINWNQHAADGRIQSYYGSIYGTWSSDHFFIDAVLMGAHNNYSGKRHIKFTGVNRNPRNKHEGNEALAHLNLGGLFKAGWLSINPFVSFDYIFLHQNGFKEHGADSLNLSVRKTRNNYIRGEAGFNFNGCIQSENSRWVPQLTLGVIREWRPNGKHYSCQLEGIDSTFRVVGLSPNRTLFTPGASITALFCDERLSVELSYDAEFGSHYWDQNVNLQLGYSF